MSQPKSVKCCMQCFFCINDVRMFNYLLQLYVFLPRQKNIGPPGLLGVGRGADNPTSTKKILLRNLRNLKPDRSARDDIAKSRP
jgi:hypothetical protein